MFFFFYSCMFLFGLVLIVLFVGVVLVSLVWVLYDMIVLNIVNCMKLLSWMYLFGIDQFGCDILSMIMVGVCMFIVVVFVVVGIGMSIGVFLGFVVVVCKGGLFDEFIMCVNDFVFVFFSFLIVVMIMVVFGVLVLNVIIVIGIFNILVFVCLICGVVLFLWSWDYILVV